MEALGGAAVMGVVVALLLGGVVRPPPSGSSSILFVVVGAAVSGASRDRVSNRSMSWLLPRNLANSPPWLYVGTQPIVGTCCAQIFMHNDVISVSFIK